MAISGFQIAQVRPGVTTTVSAFTASMLTQVTRIVISNTTGTAANASVFHDDDGSTFDATTALLFAKSVPANDTITIEAQSENSGIGIAKNGQIGVQTGTASALTFTLYGVTQSRALA